MDQYNQSYGTPQPNSGAVHCTQCGTAIPAGSVYCPNCGHAANPAPTYQNTYANAAPTYPNAAPTYGGYNPNPGYQQNVPPMGEYVSKSEYMKKYLSEPLKKNIKTVAIICYVLSGIVGVTVFLNPLALIDLAICLGLTLGMHLGKNKGCAIGILVYGIVACLLNLILSGSFGGWGWIAAGAYAISVFKKADQEYAAYSSSLMY